MTTPPEPSSPYNPQYPPPVGNYPNPGQYPNVPPPPGYGMPGGQPGGYGYPSAGPGYPPPPGYPQVPGYPQSPYPPPPAPYADWLRRVGGFLIDSLIILVPTFALFGIATALTVGSLHCTTDPFGRTSCTGNANPAGIVLEILAWVVGIGLGLYLAYVEGTTGQTPGKRVVGIRLVRERDYQVLGFGMAFLRRLAHFLDSIACYIGWLWPLWDMKRQTFADKVTNSVVLRA